MLERILPGYLNSALKRLDYQRLYEVRLRAGHPVSVNYGGKFYFLRARGLTTEIADTLTVSFETLGEIAVRACDYSLYSVGDRIASGFLTVAGGIRIGLCGEAVTENGHVKTLKNFSAMNIRVAHEVGGCSSGVMPYVYATRPYNTLLVSPPGCGKTTFLRDIAVHLSAARLNVLLVDERCEIASVQKGVPQLDVGLTTDVLSGCNKAYAFEVGIRTMRPDVIVTDELSGDDAAAVADAAACGVAVVASVHAYDQHDLSVRGGLNKLLSSKVIDRFILLDDTHGPGSVHDILDRNLNSLLA